MKQIHVVFPDGDKGPVAAFTNRKDAEKACGIFEVKDRVEHWIADLTLSDNL